ncbi:AAA family ATPase [Actinomadura yumaensis]|uniref:AAA family ATPase n=1 Tax=Actinomadura yumaensis TaxID=111807 RepID=UPI00361F7157
MPVSLVERDEELAALDGLFAELPRARSRVVVVSGGTATGKTSLLRAFGERAVEHGALFLSAVASRIERGLPMGVLEQLFRNPDLPSGDAERAMRWLDAGALNTSAAGPGGSGQVTSVVLRGLCEVLRGLAERQPVVIAVDDVHYADETSLRCLLYLLRRLRSSRLHVIFSECRDLEAANALLRSEFLREPFFRQIRVEPLTKAGVARLLRRSLGDAAAQDLTPAFHEATSGYPALVQALIEDHRAAAAAGRGELGSGMEFSRAVMTFLYRYEPPVCEVARAIAILGKAASTTLLGRLLDLAAESTAQAVNALTKARILENGDFRSEIVRAAILDATPSGERMAMHGSAAVLLHNEGAAPTDVAAHIVAAGRIEAPWVVPLLREAAEHALANDDVRPAIRHLRAAYRLCDDERLRPEIASALADAEWRVDPSAVLRHLPDFAAPARTGRPELCDTFTPITYLLWHGRVGEALGIVDDLVRTQDEAAESGTAASVDLDTPRLWLSYLYPGVLKAEPVPAHHEPEPTGALPDLQEATMLAAELVDENESDALTTAEGILQRSRLSNRTLAPLTTALAVLMYNDRLEQAASWCDSSWSRRSPGAARRGTRCSRPNAP